MKENETLLTIFIADPKLNLLACIRMIYDLVEKFDFNF